LKTLTIYLIQVKFQTSGSLKTRMRFRMAFDQFALIERFLTQLITSIIFSSILSEKNFTFASVCLQLVIHFVLDAVNSHHWSTVVLSIGSVDGRKRLSFTCLQNSSKI
jgi:hypothetical protein